MKHFGTGSCFQMKKFFNPVAMVGLKCIGLETLVTMSAT
jgi:hypothetical protein